MSSTRIDPSRTTVVHAYARTALRVTGAGSDDAVPSVPIVLTDKAAGVSAVPLPAIGDVVGNLYELVGLLGEGMFGRVYVARRLDVPEHQVALKLLPRSLYATRNVERELVMLATVGHPNVVQLKDHGTTPDYVWLTMPVYHGETLAQRLERGPLTPRQAYDVFLPIARGLEALHAAGLRHQDIKPDNIFLAVFGGRVHPIILDLGVAAEVDATFVAGTALYAAPEQIVVLSGVPAFASLSAKMDTYGLAATLLQALVGPKHFPGEAARSRDEMAEAQTARVTDPIALGALAEVSGAPRDLLEAAFRRWLALEPAERPSMSEFADQLDVLLEPEREEERVFERSLRQQRVSLQRVRAVVLAMLAIGVAGAAFAYNKRETIQLASQLAQAEQSGKDSFDRLDKCVASFQLTRSRLDICTVARETDRANYKLSLDEVRRTGTSSMVDRAREAQRYAARVKVCEDDALVAKKLTDAELAESLRQRSVLAAERDKDRAVIEEQRAEIAALTEARSAESMERATDKVALGTCRAALAQANAPRPSPAPHPPHDGPLDRPGASSTPEVTEPPAPPPAQAPPPPAPAPVPPPAQAPKPAPSS